MTEPLKVHLTAQWSGRKASVLLYWLKQYHSLRIMVLKFNSNIGNKNITKYRIITESSTPNIIHHQEVCILFPVWIQFIVFYGWKFHFFLRIEFPICSNSRKNFILSVHKNSEKLRTNFKQAWCFITIGLNKQLNYFALFTSTMKCRHHMNVLQIRTIFNRKIKLFVIFFTQFRAT